MIKRLSTVSNRIFFSPHRQKVFRVIPQNDEQVEILNFLASIMEVKDLGSGYFVVKINISPFAQITDFFF